MDNKERLEAIENMPKISKSQMRAMKAYLGIEKVNLKDIEKAECAERGAEKIYNLLDRAIERNNKLINK